MVSLIFPLIILLIIIALVALNKAHIPLNKTRLAVGLYVALLLVSVPVFYAVAEPGAPEPMPEPRQIIERDRERITLEEIRINSFYEAFHEGRLSEYEGAEIIARWRFDYQEESLEITFQDYRLYSTLIAVERKEADDGQLDVLYYAPKQPFDLTLVNPPDIRLAGNQLQILEPERLHLEVVQFFHDFTMAQFTGLGISSTRGAPVFFGDNSILYLRIPEDLRIDTDESTEHRILFINE